MIERYSDGNMADVIRDGDVVRKSRGVWWDATRQVLEHLEQQGYAWSPRIVSETDHKVELTHIPGTSLPASLVGFEQEDLLRTIGQRTRELHDALDGFSLRPGTECVPWPVQPARCTIVCHNDLSPWNTILQDNAFMGFIDWDLVSYGSREWELAWICWRWAPLYPAPERTGFDIGEQARRCNILLDSYGRDALDLRGFVTEIDRRMQCGLEVVEVLGAQGVPGFDRLLATGMHLSGHDDRAWLARHRDQIVAALDSPALP